MSGTYWKKFLIDAGIPVRAAESYSSSFVDNRITEGMVPDLTKGILNDLGINIIGDVITILKHAIYLTEKSNHEKQNARCPTKKLNSEKKAPSNVKKMEGKKVEATKEDRKKVNKRSEGVTTVPAKLVSSSVKSEALAPNLKKALPVVPLKRVPPKVLQKRDATPIEVNKKVKLTKKHLHMPPKQSPHENREKKSLHKASPQQPIQKHSKPLLRKPLLKSQIAQSESESSEDVSSCSESDDRYPVQRRVYGKAQSNAHSEPLLSTPHFVEHHTQRNHGPPRHSQPHHDSPHHGPPHHSSPHHGSPHHGQPHHGPPHHGSPLHDAVSHHRTSAHSTHGSPVIFRKVSESDTKHQQVTGPLITRVVTERAAPFVQTVRCVSPDSTTAETAHKPQQTTTVILNTKGKCSVRPVSPPNDNIQSDCKRKIMAREDGKSALTRVVQRHLLHSPKHSPKRSKSNEIESMVSELHNSFRSDAEELESKYKNKFRSEEDKFDLITDKQKKVDFQRKIVSNSSSEGRSRKSITDRLGRSADNDRSVTSSRLGSSRVTSASRLGTSISSKRAHNSGAVAARVLSENRLSKRPASTRRTRSEGTSAARESSGNFQRRQSDGIFKTSSNDASVFSRLGKM